MVERLFADRTDRMGALRRGVADRAHRVAPSVAAGDLAFEASSIAAGALRLAVLFDDRERACRPPAPALGDRNNLVSHACVRGPSCRTRAGREGERGTHDRNRAWISRRGDRDAPRNGGVSTDRSSSLSRALFAIRDTCWRPASSRARTPRQTTLAWTQIAGIVFLTPILPWVWRQPQSAVDLASHGGNGRFRGHRATEC